MAFGFKRASSRQHALSDRLRWLARPAPDAPRGSGFPSDSAGRPAAWPRCGALGSCSRMMPLRAALSRSVSSFNSCSGVIGFQSLAQRSAPNTTMPRDCSRSSVAGVLSKPGKRKNGVLGVVVAPRAAPFRPPRCRDRSASTASSGLICARLRMGPGVGADGVALGRDPPHQFGVLRGGLADQEEGRAHAFAGPAPPAPSAWSAATGRHRRSARPRGPRSGSVCGKLFSPTRGVVAASTARMREVPSASVAGAVARPGPPRSTTVESDEGSRQAASATSSVRFRPVAYFSLRLALPIG